MPLKATSFAGLALAAAVSAAAPARAAQIILDNLSGFNAQQASALQTAANFWADTILNPVRITIDTYATYIGGPCCTLGETYSSKVTESVQSVEAALVAHATSPLDMIAIKDLPALTPSQTPGIGGLSVVTPGYTDPATNTGINTAVQVFDNDGSLNNTEINLTTANARALGFATPAGADATIIFNTDALDDYYPNPTRPNNMRLDLVGAAIHEMGHALGFTSGVDTYDELGAPRGYGSTYDANDAAMGDVLDLFRYSADPLGDGPQLDWSPGVASYFSVDGGATDLGAFSTGAYNGDGFQASHWLHSDTNRIGIMDPEVVTGGAMSLTQLDFDAFDAIGYNLRSNGLCSGSFTYCNTVNIAYRYDPQFSNFQQTPVSIPVPEPSAWALLILGLGGAGAALRQARKRPAGEAGRLAGRMIRSA